MSKTFDKPRISWTLDNCLKTAKRFKTRKAWREKYPYAYTSAWRNDWLELCCNHMETLGNLFLRGTYIYIWSDRSVYVGITCDYKRRHKDHQRPNTVYFNKTSELGQPSIQRSGYIYNLGEAGKKEKELIFNFNKEGFAVLNKTKGGETGSDKRYWTLEKCMKKAKKYKTRTEWFNKARDSYCAAQKNGWLIKCCDHMIEIKKPNFYWTLEKCKEEALKYNQIRKWDLGNSSSYVTAKREGWMKECTGHMSPGKKPNGYWNLERCKEISKDFRTIKEWQEKSGASYSSAYRNKWVDECRKNWKKSFER